MISKSDKKSTAPLGDKIRWHQWPNVLALDAAAFAVAWQFLFADLLDRELPVSAHWVLAFSVWLTYTADRLLDVAPRSRDALLSVRHRFARAHQGRLWAIWAAVLIADLALAFTGLTAIQLRNGWILLLVALLYTVLNQLLSRRFFPKELCVAFIFAAGALLFVGPPFPLPGGVVFASLCFIDCLMLGHSERSVDQALGTRALATRIPESALWILGILTAAALPWIAPELRAPILLTLAALACLHLMRQRKILTAETFRIGADGVLFLGPLLYWIL